MLSDVTIISKLKLVCFELTSSSAGSRQQTIVADPPKITTSPGPYRRRPLPPVLFSDALLRKSHSKTKLVFLPNITGQAPIVELPSVPFLLRSSETKLDFPLEISTSPGPSRLPCYVFCIGMLTHQHTNR